MAWDRDTKLFHNVAFQQPRIHGLDHQALVVSILRGWPGRLKRYCQCCQMLPLQLPLVEEQDEQTRLFGELRKSCKEDALTWWKQNNWILEESWWPIAHRAMLRHIHRLCQMRGCRLYRQIGALLCKDPAEHMKGVGTQIEPKLAGGNVQETFCHKGWYRAASEMQAKLCFHTMEHQTSERVDLYARRSSPGYPFPINVERIKINDNVPLDGEIWLAAGKLSNGRVAGASRMRAKHVKEWLRGIKREEDPAGQGGIPGNGDNWCLFLCLIQASWTNDIVPCQLLWIIVVLIPKGGGDYHGIRLLELIWKVIEQIIDHRLDAFELHDSLHGCRK
jgi:hypothetical protein